MSQGTSIISEGVWDNRFKYVDQLIRMGGEIEVNGKVAVITGVDHLNGNIAQVADAMEGINNTVEDVATGVSDIAGKTTDIVDGTSITAEKVGECQDCVSNLEGIVGRFTLE